MEDKELGNFVYFSPRSHHPLKTWSIKYMLIAWHQKLKKRSIRFNFSKLWKVQYAVVWFPIFGEYMSDGPYLELHLCTFVAPVFCFYDIRYAPKVLYISKFTNTRSISSIFPIPMILFQTLLPPVKLKGHLLHLRQINFTSRLLNLMFDRIFRWLLAREMEGF